MAAKLYIIVALIAISLVAVLGAPRALSSDADVKKSVIEFLKQDTEFLSELQKAKLVDDSEPFLSRSKRQVEIDDNNTDSVEADEKPGFFDRAAKFIVDLLQRFLKWINTDGN